jgi:A/G-specific adenine glycosylase
MIGNRISKQAVDQCIAELTAFFNHGSRTIPWREPEQDGSYSAYKILVSEIMLQQTQVVRVIPKYQAFLNQFPTIDSLVSADLSDVLRLWVGLGYNRRAKYLWQAAQQLKDKQEPWTCEDLVSCVGIGPNTANAVLAYAYNQQVLFIETNIRSVILHHFFKDQHMVKDAAILDILQQIVPWHSSNYLSPRLFYWAMMDYGTHLKATHGNPNIRSRSHAVQATFVGSNRQIRGKIIQTLAVAPTSVSELKQVINDDRFDEICKALEREGLIKLRDKTLMLYNDM